MSKKKKPVNGEPSKKTRFGARPKGVRNMPPGDVPLPGMEQIRNAKLDRLCRMISETRAIQNQARTDEAGYEIAALRCMQDDKADGPNGRFAYRHAGVELVRLVGEEKLKVKTSKDAATSNPVTDEELGTGQGPASYPADVLDE